MLDLGVDKCVFNPPHGGKIRTVSCSTEESGVESLSPSETRCGSVHSEQSTHHSEAESETSDYPRSTPSPSNGKPAPAAGQSNISRTQSVDVPCAERAAANRPSRRSTVPSIVGGVGLTNLQNLKVSILKLPAATLKAHLADSTFSQIKSKDGSQETKRSALDSPEESRAKKVKLEENPAFLPSLDSSSQNSEPCNYKVLPKSSLTSNPVFSPGLRLKDEEEYSFENLGAEEQTDLIAKAEDMKLEIAKIDSILQGNLLLDKSSHKISELLIFESLKPNLRIKSEEESIKAEAEINNPSPGSDLTPQPHDKTDLREPREDEEEEEEGRGEELQQPPDREFVKCRWRGCGLDVEDMHLLEHIQSEHLVTPDGSDQEKGMKCLWLGCKVYGAVSLAKDWLRKHVTNHVGSKPFRCILETCRLKFSTQISLSRHVNSHFKPPQPPAGQSSRRTPESTPIKFYIRKTRRKNRSRPAAPLNNNIDLFDVGTMAGIKDGLSRVKRKPRSCRQADMLGFDASGSSVVLTSRVLARRLDEQGNISFLVRWHPRGILEEEWIPQQSFRTRRKVQLNQLKPMSRDLVEDHIFGHRPKIKQPRKTKPYQGPPSLT